MPREELIVDDQKRLRNAFVFVKTGLDGRKFDVPKTPVLLDQNPAPRRAIFVERERHARAREGNTSYPSRAIITDQYLFIRNFEPGRWPAGESGRRR